MGRMSLWRRLAATGLLALQPAGASSALAEEPMRVVSYNILADHVGNGWPERRAAVTAYLGGSRPAILAIQEATERQIGDLVAALPHLAHVVGERSDGHRGDQGWYEFNPIFYDPSRFRAIAHSSFWVSDTPSIPGSILPGTKAHARVLTWLKIEERDTGRRVLVANVHIHGHSPTIRRGGDEVGIILAQLRRIHEGEAVLLLGDFNADTGTAGYRAVTNGGTGFSDAAPEQQRGLGTVIGPAGTTLDGAEEAPRPRSVTDGRRIDYLFTCGFADVRDYRVTMVRVANEGYFASDHHPVSAEMVPNKRCSLGEAP